MPGGLRKGMNSMNVYSVNSGKRVPRALRTSWRGFSLPCFLLVSVMLLGCEVQKEVLEELDSPDGDLRATVIRSNSHATSSYFFRFYVVPNNAQDGPAEIGKDNLMAEISKMRSYELAWTSNSTIVLTYKLDMLEDGPTSDVLIHYHKNSLDWQDAEGEGRRMYFHLVPEISG